MAEENGSAQAPAPKAKSVAAIVALVLGIVALATSFMPFVNNLSFVLALVGVVFSLVGLVGTLRGKKSGKVLAIISVILNVAAIAAVLSVQSAYKAAIDEAFSQGTTTSATVVSDGVAASASGETAAQAAADAPAEEQGEDATKNLAVGTTITTSDGLAVTVDSVETGLTNYDGSTMTGIHVTYVNNGEDGASYNRYDWKGEDVNGAQQSSGYYKDASDELSSGTLAKGGTVSGNLYFDGDLASVLYFGNMFDKTAAASWSLS